ncbi:hypothetical protein Asulf_01015 [Archaeoglobus sulfaticallidus PM70-1]|uniref:RsbT co-antagonist protein RsbRD N-terminal domain-containing protein n=1 Tax=Archaeoglobus sulfaticallidus PM70-1 TaxID=387631 RepID=N0BBQ5_9EURY|nr:hypothetical protein [Archaeoglobus sulfaticallidus]AGK61019.1 hypothetical protein Asulf_01015 [Archaeoglobus sulfaticallidus PM70-1]
MEKKEIKETKVRKVIRLREKDLRRVQKAIHEEWKKMMFGERFKAAIEVEEYLDDCTSRIVSGVIDLFSGNDPEDLDEAVDNLMRYLATDRFLSPGDAIMMLLNLKELIYSMFPNMSIDDYRKLDRIFYNLARLSFDRYAGIREEIFELRLMEKEKEKRMLERSIELALEDQEFYDNMRVE